jgi:hypothetical protein
MQVPDAGGSCYAAADAARQAVEAALPSIERLLQSADVSGLGVLAVVVMDPALTPADCNFADAVLLQQAIGPRERWDVDYMAFALDKARLSWRHGADSALLQWQAPQRLRRGDSLLDGGVWLDGIVVAASGAMPWYDEAFALCVAAHFRAIAKRSRQQARGAIAAAPQ